MNINIREANKGDLAVILNLYQEPGFDDPEVLDLASARRIFERMGKYPNYTLYVAEVGGEIAGTFALLIMDNLAHWERLPAFWKTWSWAQNGGDRASVRG